jgi:hypothetical protein
VFENGNGGTAENAESAENFFVRRVLRSRSAMLADDFVPEPEGPRQACRQPSPWLTEYHMANESPRFVICVRNDGYAASLETRKVYQELPDPAAAKQHLIRVIDDSGEDYLYPRDMFMPVELSGEVMAAIFRT